MSGDADKAIIITIIELKNIFLLGRRLKHGKDIGVTGNLLSHQIQSQLFKCQSRKDLHTVWKTGKRLPGCVSASGVQSLCPVSEVSGRVLHDKNVLTITFLETPEGLTSLTLHSPSRDKVKVRAVMHQ